MANVKISILTEFLGKGMKDADKSVKGLERSVKNLGYLFGGGFLGAKVLAFSKTAVKAFVADDKAAQILNKTLQNLGLSFETLRVSNFISEMQNLTGVLDDQLRPAFQRLLTTTGSVSESQKLLKTALDLSAAGYGDVVSIASDLSKAYVGQTRSLAKYGLGLSQAQLKGMKFEEILGKINSKFGGSAALAADSYSGKIDRLSAAAADATEIIGEGLVEALGKAFGGGTGDRIDNTASKIRNLAKVSSGAINTLADVFQATFDTRAYLEQSMAGTPAYKGVTPAIQAELATKVYEDRMKFLRNEMAAAAKITKDKKTQLALDKAKASLAKASATFDITKINLAAALKGKISKDEENRLLALQAIENGNGEDALKYIARIDAARADAAAKELARQKLSYEDALAKIAALNAAISSRQQYLLNIGPPSAAIAGAGSVANMGAGQADFGGAAYQAPTNPYGSSYYGATGRDPMPTVSLSVNIDGKEIASSLTNLSNSGISSSSAKSIGQFN